ncbi:MAG: 4Fe-4S binding protein [Candidatus Thermoplasmatota archaeon]|nr:4Fe-4S binding protein [Candidatus Thermoplasmatota archaeon]MBS3790222.1 4Fe-4S binding protein [Candidatus Thermoplasmatota archaeon]
MKREKLLIKLINKFFPQRFRLANLTNYPVIGDVVDKLFFEEDNMFYLTKDEVIEINETIEMPDNYVLPSKIVDHFIEEADFHWIMNLCICRKSNKCEDYPIELGCLFLGEAAKDIDPELGRPVTKDEALEHVEKCREAGLVHLIGRNKLDPFWLDVSPGKKLMTICNCCPCCCLWKMLPDLTRDIGDKIKKMPGIEIEVNERCIGCSECTEVCFVDAIKIKDGVAVISEDCRGCGRCIEVCPESAIDLKIKELDYYDNSIEELEGAVDLS